ncbi:uncharacterized protein N7482_001728 [Penicillium canariense]|uniref:Zn(2)-C6 fungal-type domain-containing protein n=1 Tax=Penicillium canariense TaxID=189055 RepID=A0A9W9LTD8_9EURO|nr:uncharacterized protein N7482_001728 [Penicillium canariense]KAJ5175851.1 hypothetical protein N7482_001728 [Penicillium canariense]
MSSPRPLKRQRIYRACDQCRRRKSKCDGEQPICKICHAANRTCTYQNGGGRRGLPSGYVRSLEITLGLILQHVPTSEGAVHNVLRDLRGKGNFLKSGRANHSVALWRKSKLSREVNQLLTLDSEDVGNDGSDWEPVETQDQDENMDDLGPAPIDPGPNEAVIIPSLPRPIDTSPNPVDWLIPDNTPDLLDFYFTYTQCWFPILERRDLLRAMHVNQDRPTPGHTSCRMVLWTVISYISTLKCTDDAESPSPSTIQLFIQQQLLMDPGKLDLGHVHAILIFVLTQISLGHIYHAWTLVGQATRMLASVPLTARKSRFRHTFHGCVFLDNILSASLGRTPCLSSDEQLEEGPVEEDDVDEWDVWPASRSKTVNGGRMSAAPLRALSSFNAIRQFMQYLSRILYQPTAYIQFKDLLDELREKQGAILYNHPYNNEDVPNPPLLMLHLTSTFTTLSLVCRVGPVLPATTDLCIGTIHRLLELLEHYLEIAGETGISPLVHCFVLRCQQCLNITTSTLSLPERKHLESRIYKFVQLTKSTECLQMKNQQDRLSTVPSLNPDGPSVPLAVPKSTICMASIEESSLVDLPSIHGPGAYTTLAPLPSPEGYDALFEEMVTSFPSNRLEPAFAHNLGFYDGDLDTDFLAQLQQPPA